MQTFTVLLIISLVVGIVGSFIIRVKELKDKNYFEVENVGGTKLLLMLSYIFITLFLLVGSLVHALISLQVLLIPAALLIACLVVNFIYALNHKKEKVKSVITVRGTINKIILIAYYAVAYTYYFNGGI